MAESIGVQKVRAAFAAFASADPDAVSEYLAPDVVWHVPGNNVIAGDYKGPEDTVALFGRMLADTDGTWRSEIHDVVGNDEHVVALRAVTAERHGKRLDQKLVDVFHVDRDGRITERWLFAEDSAAGDDFWS